MAVALRTARLLLREWRDEDREPFAAMSADPEVMQYLGQYRPGSLDWAATSDAWIARMRAHNDRHGFGYWAVELPGDAPLIGLSRVESGQLSFAPAVEIGWRLAPRYWRQGYASEAARAAIEDGFSRLGLAEIVAFTVPVNERSWRVMERLGMTRDAADDFDHPAFSAGHPLRRHVLYHLRR